MTAYGIANATERLYASLFSAATAFALVTALWGLVISPFNDFNDDLFRSALLGGLALTAASLAYLRRRTLLLHLRRHPEWLIGAAAFGVALLWLDGGWRSSYYLASYSAIALASVVGGLRWSAACAAILALGYVGGLAVNGYTWSELHALRDADSVVANAGGYFIAAAFFALPVEWLGSYVGRINRIAGETTSAQSDHAAVGRQSETGARSDRLNALTARETQTVQLVVAGMSDMQIAEHLVVSPRTIHSHVQAALRKTGAGNRTALAVLAVREGLAPSENKPAAREALGKFSNPAD